jgi:hypothetical protein
MKKKISKIKKEECSNINSSSTFNSKSAITVMASNINLAKTIRLFKSGLDVAIPIDEDLLNHLRSNGMEEVTRELVCNSFNECKIVEINDLAEFMRIDYFDLKQNLDSGLLNTSVCLAICFDFGNKNAGGYLISINNKRYVIFQFLWNTVFGIETGYLTDKNEIGILNDHTYCASKEFGVYELGDYISFYNRYVEYKVA